MKHLIIKNMINLLIKSQHLIWISINQNLIKVKLHNNKNNKLKNQLKKLKMILYRGIFKILKYKIWKKLKKNNFLLLLKIKKIKQKIAKRVFQHLN